MATTKTQRRIIAAAIDMFNDQGVKAVSVNRIAGHLAISRGNLHYHFRTKEDLIAAIFDQLAADMAAGGQTDIETPTLAHLQAMFERYMHLVWQYRFFFREMTALLNRNPRLKSRYAAQRRLRLGALAVFFEGLVQAGVLRRPPPPVGLQDLIQLSWIVSENWLAYVEADGMKLAAPEINRGFALVMCLFEPYLTQKA